MMNYIDLTNLWGGWLETDTGFDGDLSGNDKNVTKLFSEIIGKNTLAEQFNKKNIIWR